MYEWSNEAKERTRDALGGFDLSLTQDGLIRLKHSEGAFGMIGVDDLVTGVLKVVDVRTKEVVTLRSAEELIAAGWVID